MTVGEEININTLSGLSLAKYVLKRLVNDHESVEKIAVDFGGDKKFIIGVIHFLDDIGWIRQDSTGNYRMTRKGKTNTIIRHRQMVNWRILME
jgi:hypothetical protein